MPRPLIATIDLAAMRHNLHLARQAAPDAKVWAVVKANAYGHGLERAMRAFADADGLALVEIAYAVQLRAWGWTKPILLLEGFFDAEDLATLQTHDLQTALHHAQQITLLEQAHAAGRLSKPLTVHLKINTGMQRLGFVPEQCASALARLQALQMDGPGGKDGLAAGLAAIHWMTHFANADLPDQVVSHLPSQTQMARFTNAVATVDGELALSTSVANSAAILMHPDAVGTWIRPGIMLYGATPGTHSAAHFGLRAAMHLHSQLISVQTLVAGDVVGYGSQFTAPGPMRIGVVACGYADGYPRQAPTGTPVLVNGVRCSLVGRVSMDMLSVDLTPVPEADVGAAVELWGAALPIDEVAGAAGTIGYELMCALAQRVQVQEIS